MRRRLDTWQILALCGLAILSATVVVDLARLAGGLLGGLAWFLGAAGLGYGCGWLAGRICDD